MSFIKSVQKLKNKVGEYEILEIKVARTPLSKILSFFLNLTSLGEFKKRLNETPYDKLYHLFMIIKTKKGTFLLEKNEVIILKSFNGKIPNQTEILNADITTGLTINKLLEKTQSFMSDKFFTYKGLDNNCQYFVNSVLKANDINSDELETFVIQNTQKLFENNPRFRKIVNSITDIGAIATTAIDETKQDLEETQSPSNPLLDIAKSSSSNLSNTIFKPLLKIGFKNSMLNNF